MRQEVIMPKRGVPRGAPRGGCNDADPTVRGDDVADEVSRLRRELARAEEMLRLAEAKHRALVAQIPGIVYIVAVGDYGNARGVSPQIEDMLGISAEDWAANPCLWLDRMHPADRERVLDRVSRDWESDDPVAIEYRILDRDGAVRWVRERVTLLRDQDGRPCLIQGVVLEVPAPAAEPVACEGATAV
ncbi:MAG: PAS domain-containing protein [Actinomycetes bacterium]|jgi:PAS domain S-box-containing protein